MDKTEQLTENMVHRALRNGNKDEILELLQNNIDVNHVNEDGDTVVHAILRNEKLIEKNVVEILTVLLGQGVNPNISNKHEQTSLHLAVERRMKDAMDLLLKFGANIHAANETGDTIAHFLIEDEYQKCKSAMLYPIMNTAENRAIKERCSVSFLEYLIFKNVNFDRPNKGRSSALYAAIMYQLLHILPTLFKHTKDVRFVEKNKTLLHYFLEERSLPAPSERPRFDYNSKYATECVSTLLDRRVPILDCEKYGCTLVSMAINNREDTGIIEALISYYLSNCYNIKIVSTLHTELMNTSNSWNASESEYFFIVLSDLETKIADIKNKVPQNRYAPSRDSMRTPLHDAVMMNETTDAITLLLANGADVNAVDSVDNTPLHLAVSQNNMANVKLLLDHGASASCKNKRQLTPLHFVRWKTDEALNIADLLLSNGADVNAKDSASEMPFYLAVSDNNVEIVSLFLQNGAEIDCKSNFQLTPLHRALLSETVSLQMIELLLTSGAEVNTEDYKGETPLHLAVSKNDLTIVRWLIEHGAFVTCRKKYGQTPLHRAVIEEAAEIVELLLENGADVNLKDLHGNRPLHLVCDWSTLNRRHDRKRIVRLLLDKGARVNALDNQGKTALSLALSPWNSKLVKELRNYGDIKVHYLEHPYRDVAFPDRYDYLVEIRKLQNTAIGNDKSLFDFLRMQPNRRCAHINSEKIQQLIGSPNLHEQFPIYSCIILARYQEAVTRKSLEKLAQEALYAMTRVLFADSVDKILVLLENEDLIDIAQANLDDDAADAECDD